MSKPDYDFRINPERAVYIVGEFDEDLLKAVIPRITELRFGSDEPISLVINSRGGSTDCLDSIKAALCVHGPDNTQSRVITFVVGYAASAGATLLTLGDYAIAAPGAWLHFHGIRTFTDNEIRMEDASQLAQRLARDNRRIAQHLSAVMIGRIMHRFARLKPRIDALTLPKGKNVTLLEKYVLLATEKTSAAADQIMFQARDKLNMAKELSDAVSKLKIDPKDIPASKDLKVFAKIVSTHQANSKNPMWRLSENNISSILSEFFLLREYEIGRYPKVLEEVIRMYGTEFLNPIAFKKYKSLRSAMSRKKFLTKQTLGQIREFWYFTAAIAEQLLYGENRLTPYDAYWLGAIDEIQGDNDHYGLRQLAEQRRR
jgi:ATP-dependent protease ClpP protease subunit